MREASAGRGDVGVLIVDDQPFFLSAALDAAHGACEHEHLGQTNWALTEVVAASARSGNRHVAAAALRRLEERTRAGGTDRAPGIQARSHALLSDRDDADALHGEAIERLAGSRMAVQLARAHLL